MSLTVNSPTTSTDVEPSSQNQSGAGVDCFTWRGGRLYLSSRPFPWHDGDEFTDALEKMGFDSDAALNLADPGDGVELSIFERRAKVPEVIPQRLADLTVANYSHFVWLDGFEDFVDFLARMAPMVAAVAALADRSEKLADEVWEAKLARRGRQ